MKNANVSTPQRALDARVFAAANYTGPCARLIPAADQFAAISEIITTVAGLNSTTPPLAEVMEIMVEQIIENYGHLRIEEIKIALISSLMGKIPDAPRTFAKINLEWIGGALAAYDVFRSEAITRVRAQLPELEDKAQERTREEVNAEFWARVVSIYSGEVISEHDGKILPEVFVELDNWANENNFDRISEDRRREIFALAGDIIAKNDERAAEYAATKGDFFTATILSLDKRKTASARQLRLAREIACREMISNMKKGGIGL